MSRQMSGPVEIQRPTAVPEPFLSAVEGPHRQVGRRRIFVQTDDGNVLGVEVHRADNASKVKKAVQAALRVPTEQYNLMFGGHVLKDFSEVRNDAPILLQKGMSRSNSSPCLSPVEFSFSQRSDKSIEVVGGSSLSFRVRSLIQEATTAMKKGVDPESASGGLGGAYYFKNSKGEKIAIVKPTDEEPFAPNNPNGYVGRTLGQPGLKRNIRVGEAGMREVAAYLLDHNRFANVPHTALVKVTSPIFSVNEYKVKGAKEFVPTKIASLQKYVKHDYDASDHGFSGFPVKAIHRIGILDIRILNLDRHSGNILVRQILEDEPGTWGSSRRVEDSVELIPIDHGFSLPESLESAYFEWQHWPQASLPFSQEELCYIESLDPYREVEMLKSELPMLREASLRILVVSTTLLKLGARAGLLLSEIAGMMCSELRGNTEEISELQKICQIAKERLEVELLSLALEKFGTSEESSRTQEDLEFDEDDDQFQLEFDKESSDSETGQVVELNFGSSFQSSRLSGGVALNVSRRALEFDNGAFRRAISPTSPMSLSGFSPLGKGSFGSVAEDDEEKLEVSRKLPLFQSSTYKATGLKLTSGIRGWQLGHRVSHSPTDRPGKHPKESFSGYSCKDGESDPEENPLLEEVQLAFPSGGDIDFSQLGESTWRLYMKIFEETLQEALDAKKEANNSVLKRFGTSCKF